MSGLLAPGLDSALNELAFLKQIVRLFQTELAHWQAQARASRLGGVPLSASAAATANGRGGLVNYDLRLVAPALALASARLGPRAMLRPPRYWQSRCTGPCQCDWHSGWCSVDVSVTDSGSQ